MTLKVRLTSKGPSDINFGSDLFRLYVDAVPRAPNNFLNDLVDARSAKESEIIFSVPENAKSLELWIGDNQDSAKLPVVLRKTG
jgi:hypothetical protein